MLDRGVREPSMSILSRVSMCKRRGMAETWCSMNCVILYDAVHV